MSFDQFAALVDWWKSAPLEAKLGRLFDVLDLNEDGLLGQMDLQAGLPDVPPAEAVALADLLEPALQKPAFVRLCMDELGDELPSLLALDLFNDAGSVSASTTASAALFDATEW